MEVQHRIHLNSNCQPGVNNPNNNSHANHYSESSLSPTDPHALWHPNTGIAGQVGHVGSLPLRPCQMVANQGMMVNLAGSPSSASGSNGNISAADGMMIRPKRDFRFQVIQVPHGPKWFIFPSANGRHQKDFDELDQLNNGNGAKGNTSSDRENQDMASPTSPPIPLTPSNMPFPMDCCDGGSTNSNGARIPKLHQLENGSCVGVLQAPYMVKVTATNQLENFPAPLSEPTTRRFPPHGRFQVQATKPAENTPPTPNGAILPRSDSTLSSPSCSTEPCPVNYAVLVNSDFVVGLDFGAAPASTSTATTPSSMTTTFTSASSHSLSQVTTTSLSSCSTTSSSTFEILAVSKKSEEEADEDDDFEEDETMNGTVESRSC